MAFLDLELKLCGQHIECVRQFVFLGITIHETLNWDRYIDKIANKISRTLGVMNKLKHFLPKYTLKIMYSSLIAPHFNNNIYYGALIHIGSLSCRREQLESLLIVNTILIRNRY